MARMTNAHKAADKFFYANYNRLAEGRQVDIMKMGPMVDSAISAILGGMDPECAVTDAINEFTVVA